MSSIYTKQLKLSEGPWRIQDRHRLTIVDPLDRTIAVVKDNSQIPVEERLANAHCIVNSPELLAALKESVFMLANMGVSTSGRIVELLVQAAPDDDRVQVWAKQQHAERAYKSRRLPSENPGPQPPEVHPD